MSELRRTSRKAAAAAASSQLKWIHRWKFCRGIQPILSTRATHSILVYAVFIKLAVGPVTVVNLVTVMMERGKREMINDSRILIPDSFSTQLVGGNVCQRILVRARIFYDMKNRDLVICRYNRLEVSQNERLNRSPTLCPMQKKKKKKMTPRVPSWFEPSSSYFSSCTRKNSHQIYSAFLHSHHPWSPKVNSNYGSRHARWFSMTCLFQMQLVF